MQARIETHNERPAAVWSSGGQDYEEISRQIASALDHCVRRLDPKPGERVLDLATGTGWTARLLAHRGAKVTGVDIAADLIEAARSIASTCGPAVDYEIGDAERLRFADASFDAVVSTFGVMFASKPEAAAQEIARVCRKGGRIALVTWKPDGAVARMFQVMSAYMPKLPSPSPFAWGSRQRVTELLGASFDLAFEDGETVYYDRDGEAAWTAFVTGYGPTKILAAGLDERRRSDLERDFAAFHDQFAAPLGIAVPRQYLVTVGTRR
jgi:ubiquinone/menaquinone biosynthesis C-methylase UbiE